MTDMDEDAEPAEGAAIVNASWAGTGLATASAIVGDLWPDRFEYVVAAVAGGLFVLGIGVFLWAFALAVARSRYELIGIGGVYFLAGSAPRVVRFRLLLSLAAQVVVSLGAALIRPDTYVASLVLVPMFGLGLCGLWGARYGEFPDRESADSTSTPTDTADATDASELTE